MARLSSPFVPLVALVLVWGVTGGVSAAGQAPARAGALLGADGPQMERVGRPPHDNEVIEAFVYQTPEQAAVGVVRPQKFPSGVERLELDLRLRDMPRTGVQVRYELVNPSGALPMGEGFVTIAFMSTIGVASMDFELVPEAGRFPDGPYRLAIFMNDEEVAVLNWSVGAP